MCTAVIHYRERKLLSDINLSEKVGKVSKMTKALDVCSLPAPLKTQKRFLQRYGVSTHQSLQHVKRRLKGKSKGTGRDLNSAVDKDPSLLDRIVTGEIMFLIRPAIPIRIGKLEITTLSTQTEILPPLRLL
ncbi:hypothetical protein TNCV_3586781 [Trichonephila clavipes]|nr:hypothetical protein TNCV_3586781 [Trichonephila clavipes]